MRRDSRLQHRLSQVSALQTLKAQASRAELVQAQAERADAQAGLARSESASAAKASEIEILLDAEAFDPERWRIGCATLDALIRAQAAQARETAQCEEREAERREDWYRESGREERAEALHRKLARHLADKRDEALTLEAIGLRAARQRGDAR